MLDVQESVELLEMANALDKKGLPQLDALHVACAIAAKCAYFLTTDDRILTVQAW